MYTLIHIRFFLIFCLFKPKKFSIIYKHFAVKPFHVIRRSLTYLFPAERGHVNVVVVVVNVSIL